MGILDRSLGHPANWLDLVVARDLVADRWLVHVDIGLTMELVDGKGVLMGAIVTVVPSVFSPHAGKKPVIKVRQGYVTSGHPLSELIYACLWEAEGVVGIIWPVGVVEE